jgi:hypothetical protein
MNKLIKIFVTILSVLGLYHLFMFGLKTGVIDIDKQLLYKLYHISYNLLIIVPIVYLYKEKIINKGFLLVISYPIFKIIYNLIIFIPVIKEYLHKSFVDGASFVVIIIFILLNLRTADVNESES